MDDKWKRLTAVIGTLDPQALLHPDRLPTADRKVCPQPSECEALRRLDTTQELARIGDWEYEVATGNVTWSRQIFNLLGRAPLSGHLTFEEFLFNYSPDDSARLQKALESAIRSNERGIVEVTAKLLNGEDAPHRIALVPIADKNGLVTRINGYLQDLAGPKQAVSADFSRGQEIRFVAVNTRDVVFRVSLPDGTYEFISPAVFDVTGRAPRDWYRDPLLIWEIIHPGWRRKFDRGFRKFLRGKTTQDHVFPIFHTSGETRWLHLRTNLLRNSDGVVLAVEGIVSDITERKQQEEERKRLIRQLRKALAEVKTLSGLLPICSHCKKVRDDQGYWQQIDAFITEHSDLFFSHGLCPECLVRHYPEYAVRRQARN